MKKILFVAGIAALVTSFGYNSDHSRKGLYKGDEVTVHGGQAWTWTTINKKGEPEKIGITLTDAALNSLPVGHGAGHGHGKAGEDYWVVKFNEVANTILPFNFVLMNWNPNGHEPVNIYDKPHFDFHFYSSTPDEVLAIGAYEGDSVKFQNVPSSEFLPASYVNTGHNIPQMGAHWVDVTSPELHGKPFTETFIYGSYDGKVTFYEPMITLDFLKTQKNYERKIPVPLKFGEEGWYPTIMRVVKHKGETDIVLDGFVYRKK